jgi:hypothetical protein
MLPEIKVAAGQDAISRAPPARMLDAGSGLLADSRSPLSKSWI